MLSKIVHLTEEEVEGIIDQSEISHRYKPEGLEVEISVNGAVDNPYQDRNT